MTERKENYMKRIVNMRKIWGMVLAFAMILSSVSAPGSVVFAKSSSGGGKVQVITKTKDDSGYTTTYKYNKKGLVSKKVAKRSYKQSDEDIAETITTTYKYNKKNRISKETTTDVTKETFYETDKTTGKNIKSNKGTVTTTVKSVTTYTYDKKGRAKKAVTTDTLTKSGSKTTKYYYRSFDYYDDDDTTVELINGKIVAGYNDGAYKDRASRAYYYSGAIDQARRETVETVSYKDNGNGTYTQTSDTSYSNANYKYVYVGADGKEYDYKPSGIAIAEKKIVITNPNRNTENRKYVYQKANKRVTTSTFTYGKKKRVKKEKATEVYTTNSTRLSYNYNYVDYDGSSVYKETKDDTTSYVTNTTDTRNYTISYSYGKNGKAKKIVSSDNGVENSQSVKTTGLPNYTETEDNTVKKVTATGAPAASVETTTVANGTKTETLVDNAYTVTTDINGSSSSYTTSAYTSTKSEKVKAKPAKDTWTYKYDKNKNLSSYKYSGVSTSINDLLNETYGNQIYEGYNAEGNLVEATVSVSHTESYNGKNESTLKSGTKTLKKKLTMISNQKSDRTTTPGYDCKRVTYTLKAKSLSKNNKTNAIEQQWSIQNGNLNGFVGLSIGY
jgi:hypothetical protein